MFIFQNRVLVKDAVLVKSTISDIDECESNPCVNGKCTNEVNAWKCDCNAGYKGHACEIGTSLLLTLVFNYLSVLDCNISDFDPFLTKVVNKGTISLSSKVGLVYIQWCQRFPNIGGM